jgi:hypothetical protein
MRTIKLIFFLLGLLALFAASAPVDQTTSDVGHFVAASRDASGDDETVHLMQEEEDADANLEKRAKKKAKKPTPEKTTPKVSTPKKTKKPTSSTKSRPTPSPKPKPTPSPQPKKCTRANDNNCAKTEDYKIAEKAAKDKKKTLELNQAYLLVFKTTKTPKHHQRLVVGTVRKNAEGALDFPAVAAELLKKDSNPNQLIHTCKTLHGAKCEFNPINEYSCAEALERNPKGRFKFASGAAPEFADPETFWRAGKCLYSAFLVFSAYSLIRRVDYRKQYEVQRHLQ